MSGGRNPRADAPPFYPPWYLDDGENIGEGSDNNGYCPSYGADQVGIAAGWYAAGGMSRSSSSYGVDSAMDWPATGYGTDFFENGEGSSSSAPFPSRRVGAGMYGERQHARADHQHTGAGGSAADYRFDLFHGGNSHTRGQTFPSPRIGVDMRVSAYYAPDGWRSRSPLQWCTGHVDDEIANQLNDITIGGGGENSVVCRCRLPAEFLSPGQALFTGDHVDAPTSSSWPTGRDLMNVNPYVGKRLEDVRGRMSSVARDLPGCQFLARMVVDGGAGAARQVLDEVAGEVVRFMGHSVGNVLVEKLAEFWTDEESITRVLGFLGAASPGQILAAAKNHAGSKILQKLIERIAGQPERAESFTRTLAGVGESGVLSLMEDMSGSLLILKCLDSFTEDQNQFITDVALKFFPRVCHDRHGCYVFNRCIDKARDVQTRATLIRAVCRHGLLLAEHGAGNYVVQHVIEAVPAAPWARDSLHRAFRGQYVSLSRQKASSHVVQRCLEFFSTWQTDEIVWELLHCERHCAFGELISDPYANYVLQTAMERADQGQMHNNLIATINLYKNNLMADRFAKQIFQKLHIIMRRPNRFSKNFARGGPRNGKASKG